MESKCLFTILILSLLYHKKIAQQTEAFDCSSDADCNINCNDPMSCDTTVIRCPINNVSCNIICNGMLSCSHSQLYCPSDASCNLACTGWGACKYSTIEWSSTPGLSSFSCTSNECNYVAPPPQQNALLPLNNYTNHQFTCDSLFQCSLNILCPTNANCTISCDGYKSCEEATIQCPSQGSCNIQCNNTYACKNAKIDWADHQDNSVLCGAYDGSCYGVQFKPYDQYTDYVQVCDSEEMCKAATFDCPTNGNCTIVCSALNSCKNSIINCPSEGSCNIHCIASSACSRAQFNWIDSQPNNLYCTGSVACLGVHFKPYNQYEDYYQNCSELVMCRYATFECPSDANCHIDCNGDYTCADSEIYCPQNGDCIVSCQSSKDACYNAVIYGPRNGGLRIVCDGTGACESTVIYARNSSYFYLNISGIASTVVRNASIWFPQKNGSIPSSYIYGSITSNGQKYYAVNGWLDIHVDYEGNYTNHGGIMYCNVGYTESCPFAVDAWQCSVSNHICDNPIYSTGYTTTTTMPTDSTHYISESATSSITSLITTTIPAESTALDSARVRSITTNVIVTDNTRYVSSAVKKQSDKWMVPVFTTCALLLIVCIVLFVCLSKSRNKQKKRTTVVHIENGTQNKQFEVEHFVTSVQMDQVQHKMDKLDTGMMEAFEGRQTFVVESVGNTDGVLSSNGVDGDFIGENTIHDGEEPVVETKGGPESENDEFLLDDALDETNEEQEDVGIGMTIQ